MTRDLLSHASRFSVGAVQLNNATALLNPIASSAFIGSCVHAIAWVFLLCDGDVSPVGLGACSIRVRGFQHVFDLPSMYTVLSD